MTDNADEDWFAENGNPTGYMPALRFAPPGLPSLVSILKSLKPGHPDIIILNSIIQKLTGEELETLSRYTLKKAIRRGPKTLLDNGPLTHDILREYERRAVNGEPREKLKVELATRALETFKASTGRHFNEHDVKRIAKAIERTAIRIPPAARG